MLICSVVVLGNVVGSHSAGAQGGPTSSPTTTVDPNAPTTTVDPNAPTTTVDPNAPTTTSTVPLRPILPVPILSSPVVFDPGAALIDGRNEAGVVVAPSDALASVPLQSERYDAAVAARDSIADELADATERIIAANDELSGLGGGQQAITELSQRSLIRVAKLTRVRDEARRGATAVALRRFTSSSELEDTLEAVTVSSAALADGAHRRFIADQASRELIARRAAAQDALDEAIERTASLARQIASVESRQRVLRADLARATKDQDRATDALAAARREVRLSRANAVVAGSDLPMVALDAYWRAAAVMAIQRPACGIDWWALAGIGRSESNHGRFGGSEPDSGGRVSVAIAGLPLDGTRGTRLIPDSDGGQLDGDPVVDRAVGALQFIPGTWRRWARDGSGDDIADPQNLYDGALSAAVYLCNSGPLDTDEGRRRAFFAYNRSTSYVELVLSRGRVYEQLPVPPTRRSQ